MFKSQKTYTNRYGDRYRWEPVQPSTIFYVGGKQVLSITENGFHYKGETIEDAGEAHKAFMEVMEMMKNDNAV
jgi:hypothetical protein